MTTPLFTILCATYQQAEYLPDMLASVEAQDGDDFELVVVDDGSTDATAEILADWHAGAPPGLRSRTRIERTANGGQSAAYEHGFAVSRGQWVCLLDSDDRFLPGKLERLRVVVAGHPEAGMIMHPLNVVDQAGRSTGVTRPQGAKLSHGDLREEMRSTARHSAPGASGLIFRRDVLERMFPAPTKRFRFAADAYLSFGAACMAPVVALQEPLADYRMQPGGQYLIRMLSSAGLQQQVDFQRTIARHFGVEHAIVHNSFFARNHYAAVMLDGSASGRLTRFRTLVQATVKDPYFGRRQKATLLAFWIVTLFAGRRWFPSLWGWFQHRQTGWHQVARA